MRWKITYKAKADDSNLKRHYIDYSEPFTYYCYVTADCFTSAHRNALIKIKENEEKRKLDNKKFIENGECIKDISFLSIVSIMRHYEVGEERVEVCPQTLMDHSGYITIEGRRVGELILSMDYGKAEAVNTWVSNLPNEIKEFLFKYYE
jgi:hypothetical protein